MNTSCILLFRDEGKMISHSHATATLQRQTGPYLVPTLPRGNESGHSVKESLDTAQERYCNGSHAERGSQEEYKIF